ncbi:MAG TPA: hypothetical protein VFV34_06645 [Blastocatellia bacterium]|nr:hypothetical protein [Blastocatellia bacterium]
MPKRIWLTLFCLLVVGTSTGTSHAQAPSSAQVPDIAGSWTGVWSIYNPAQNAPAQEVCKKLDCKVTYSDGAWQATFEGDCGRPYKYTIKMEGRQVGKAVLFKGTVDLGAKDGGVFDWIGRANEKEFVGFYTSAAYTGVFSLSKTK